MGNSLTIKRLAAPTSWHVEKKGFTFITKPHPGAHSYALGTSLTTILRDVLHLARTGKEVRYILNQKEILINGTRRKDKKFLAGFMDTITLAPLKENYRLIMTTKGTLATIRIDAQDAAKKLAKIIGKTLVKGHVQLNLSDGRNIVVEKDVYKLGDSLLFEVPDQKVIGHFKLEKKVPIMLTDGTHIGKIGFIEDIVGEIIIFKVNNEVLRTKKEFAFVLGKEEPVIKVKEQ